MFWFFPSIHNHLSILLMLFLLFFLLESFASLLLIKSLNFRSRTTWWKREIRRQARGCPFPYLSPALLARCLSCRRATSTSSAYLLRMPSDGETHSFMLMTWLIIRNGTNICMFIMSMSFFLVFFFKKIDLFISTNTLSQLAQFRWEWENVFRLEILAWAYQLNGKIEKIRKFRKLKADCDNLDREPWFHKSYPYSLKRCFFSLSRFFSPRRFCFLLDPMHWAQKTLFLRKIRSELLASLGSQRWHFWN